MGRVGARQEAWGLAGRLGLMARPRLLVGILVLMLALGVGFLASVAGQQGGVVIERGASAGTQDAAAETEESDQDAAETETSTGDAAADGQDAQAAGGDEAALCVVHVDGAVAAPGVYELTGPAPRVNDAIAAAGGLAEGADTSQINLAATVADGEKVYVPREGEQAVAATQEAAGVQGSASASSEDGLVNINTASAEELDALPGVGPATASAIIEDREANGAFSSVEDLMRVSGIGEKKFAKLQGSICV